MNPKEPAKPAPLGPPDAQTNPGHPPDDPPSPPPRHGDRIGPSRTYKTTLYRLDRVEPTPEGLPEALDFRYLRENDCLVEERQIADSPALLVHGSVPCERADWCDVVSALSGHDLAVGYSSAGCTLVVVVDEQVYALTYGTLGRHMVNLDLADPGFGIGFAVRTLKASQINRVKRRLFGLAARVDRNLVPGGQHIRHYGIDKWGEIVGQVSGTLHNVRLTACRLTERAISIEGSDSLRIDLSSDPLELIADLREIRRVSQREAPAPDLEFITQIRPIPQSERRARLDERLDTLLGEEAPVGLGIAVPMKCVEASERTLSYEVYIPRSGYKRSDFEDEVTLDVVLCRTRQVEEGRRLTSLRNGRVTMFADQVGQYPLADAAAHKWITAQLADQAAQLLYQEGQWYEIGEKHLQFLRKEIVDILSRPATLELPPWTADLEDEDAYNKAAAKLGSGFVLLDKQYLRTEQHSRGPGIEACDLLGPNLELIHVKRAKKGSSPLSHLFYQGEVSVDALKHEPDARQRLVELVHQQQPDYQLTLNFQPSKVVYAIALGEGKQLTADSLFTFAQVALYRAVRTLRNENVDVEVIGIPT